MNFIKGSLLSTSVLCLLVLTSCGNSNTVNKRTNSSTNKVEIIRTSNPEQPTALPATNSKIQADLEKAKSEGKAVFVVVTGTGVTETEKATNIAKGANAIYKNAYVLQLDRDDASNAKLVADWRLAGAPLPLVLVVSSKGMIVGGRILSQATAENIAALIPSPKLEEVYTAIMNGKNAIVVFSKKSLNDRTEVLKNCKEAVAMLNNEGVLVEVDIEDSKEANFLNQFRIDKNTVDKSLTLVVNKQGQIAGTSTSVPDAAKLVTAARTPVQGGCGPGCGPAGCGK